MRAFSLHAARLIRALHALAPPKWRELNKRFMVVPHNQIVNRQRAIRAAPEPKSDCDWGAPML